MADVPILDPYSGLDHKLGMGDDSDGLDASPSWANEFDSRRQNAYYRIQALREGKGRMLLRPDPLNEFKEQQWRELGDVAVIIDQQAGSVLGDGPELEIVGADESLPSTPDLPDPPEPPQDDEEGQDDAGDGPGAEAAAILREVMADVYAVSLEAWRANLVSIISEWQERTEERPKLVERQRWLRAWAEADRYLAKITELEHDAIVPLGDGVIVHGYDYRADRPTTEIFNPESYYPVLDDQSTNRFPRKVRIAWDYENADGDAMLRVQTWELVDITEGSEDEPAPDPGDPLKYLPEGEEQTETCLYSHKIYLADDVNLIDEIDDVAPVEIVDHEVRRGEIVPADRVPWHTDYLPIVHIPNTLSTLEHFGRSPVLRIAQAADELAQNDSWEGLAAHYAARPITALDNPSSRQNEIDLTPGQTLSGKVSVVDMARQLEQIMKRGEMLRSTLLTNSFTPEGMVGRISPDEVPSGLALSLSFTAFEQHIERMRMARTQKYALSLKMVQRLAIQNESASLVGDGPAEDMTALPARLRFGTFMPQDLAGASKVVQLLLTSGAISPETAVRMVQAAGGPIADVDDEVARLYRLMTAKADEMTAATEDPRYAIDLLRLEPIEENVDDGVDDEGGDVVIPGPALAGLDGQP